MALAVVFLAALVLLLARAPRDQQPSSAVVGVLPKAGEPAANSRFPAPPGPSLDKTASHIHHISDPGERSMRIEQFADSLNNSQIRMHLAALLDSTNAVDAELRDVLTRRWADNDPRGAADWVEQMARGAGRLNAVTQVAIAWAEQDALAAADWARGLGAEGERHAALLQIAYETARSAPFQSIQLGFESPPSPERDELIIHAARQWAAIDSPAAYEWAAKLSDASLAQKVIAEVMIVSAEQDGRSAAVQTVEALSPGPIQDRAIVSVIQRWGQSDPSSAAAWVKDFPPSPLGLDVLHSLITGWYEFDAAAAQRWVHTLPPSALRDAGLGYIQSTEAIR